MKHLKLFEELNISKEDFPEDGHELNSREKQILLDLVGEYFLGKLKIKKEDNYYYTSYNNQYNKFDGFNELKDYLLCRYHILYNESDKFLEILRSTNLDPSFDDNSIIRWASEKGHIEIIEYLLKDSRVDPCVGYNYPIIVASKKGHTEIVKLLLKYPRVDPSYAIVSASKKGHKEIVKLLLQDSRVDPSYDHNEAIFYAGKKGHTEIVKLLLEDPRVREKLTEKEIKKYETS